MRVLMVSKACTVAAYRRKLEELAALPGMDLTLVTPPVWRSNPFEPGHDRGYRIIRERPVLNGHFHLHFYRRLPNIIDEVRPHLVHLDEEPYDYVAFHGMRAARRSGAATLFFTWQNIYRRYPLPFGFFERRSLARANGAIAGNRDAAAILRRKGYTRPLYVIPQFGIDPDLFPFRPPEPVETFTAERPFRIGFSGRLVEEKGLLVLLQALSRLEGPWELRLVGGGPLRTRLAAEAGALDLAAQVRFLGAVPSDEVPEQLSQLDVLVNPSLTWQRGQTQWKEQFGRSLVEAMACGVPVIGSDSGEIPNVVGDAGLIAPEGDALALHRCLQRLMETAGLRQSLAAAGRERMLQHYTQRRIAEQTYACYQQILDRPGAGASGAE